MLSLPIEFTIDFWNEPPKQWTCVTIQYAELIGLLATGYQHARQPEWLQINYAQQTDDPQPANGDPCGKDNSICTFSMYYGAAQQR